MSEGFMFESSSGQKFLVLDDQPDDKKDDKKSSENYLKKFFRNSRNPPISVYLSCTERIGEPLIYNPKK